MLKSYDPIAAAFNQIKSDRTRPDWRLGYSTVLQRIEKLNLPAGSRILDFGCGSGNFTRLLSETGYAVTGLDVSAGQIEQARQQDSKTEYLLYRGLLANQLAGRLFDAICVNLTICCIPDSELRYVLRDLASVLKPGGVIVTLEPNLEDALGCDYGTIRFGDAANPTNGDVIEVALIHQEVELPLEDIYRTRDYHRELLNEAGFVDIRIDQPKPGVDWGAEWELARQRSPFLVITARRPNSDRLSNPASDVR